MKLIVDIPEEDYNDIITCNPEVETEYALDLLMKCVDNGTPIPDNATNGKEVLIKYCLEHSGEEIYNFLKQIFNASMSWTDSRGFIIEWLEKGGMI